MNRWRRLHHGVCGIVHGLEDIVSAIAGEGISYHVGTKPNGQPFVRHEVRWLYVETWVAWFRIVVLRDDCGRCIFYPEDC